MEYTKILWDNVPLCIPEEGCVVKIYSTGRVTFRGIGVSILNCGDGNKLRGIELPQDLVLDTCRAQGLSYLPADLIGKKIEISRPLRVVENGLCSRITQRPICVKILD